jgi:adenine deaminase
MNMKISKTRNAADVCIENAVVVNVFTRELIPGQTVAICGDTIRYVGNDAKSYLDERTEKIDASGALLLPGFIDGHNHLDSLTRNFEWARHILPTGCTTVVTETGMASNAVGPDMMKIFMESGRCLPMRVYFLAPFSVPPFPKFETAHDFPDEAYEKILRQDDVVGVGEAYWPTIVEPDKKVLEVWAKSHALGKTCEGHTAGAHGDKLMTYAYRGGTSCHESVTEEEALEKARLGYAVMVREGFVRHDLEAVIPVFQKIGDSRNLILVSDVFNPEDLLQGRGLNTVVEKAIRLGVDPVAAVQMVTLNPATYFHLRHLGAIAPGKKADLFLAESFENLSPRLVMVGGQVVARNGELTVEMKDFPFPPESRGTIRIRPLDADWFRIDVPPDKRSVRAVSVANETITKELEIDVKVVGGAAVSDPERDLVKLAVLSRNAHEPAGSLGFLHGTGLRRGAMATNIIWDTSNVLAIGATDEDMAAAVNRLVEIGGGWTVIHEGKVIAEISLPIFGLIGEMSMSELVEGSRKLDEAVRMLGMNLTRPFLTTQTLAFTGLPFLRLTDRGLVDVRKSSFVSLFV